MTSNDQAGIIFKQPTSFQERTDLAKKCCTRLEMSMPLLVDDLSDRVGHAYSGMPDRLYVIDREGKVVYKSGRGPFGFQPGEMEQALIMLLLDQKRPAGKRPQGRVPILKNREAWNHLPPASRGAGQPLPVWARALAASLPRTTAAMLELDYVQRVRSPLAPLLRGKMRWVAAHANGCRYSEAYAAADLRRAGLDARGLQQLAANQAGLPAAEQAALTFARKLTLAADTVTDAEVARLLRLYGEKQVVAMVLLLAHANFQDRLLTTLGLSVEEGGPLPPRLVRFADDKPRIPAAPRSMPPTPVAATPERITDVDWLALGPLQLHEALDKQKARPPRITVPDWEEVRKRLPASYPANRQVRIRWSLVCLGYEPELAAGWFACLRTFAEEARQDRVFEESLFWVITRTLHCFY